MKQEKVPTLMDLYAHIFNIASTLVSLRGHCHGGLIDRGRGQGHVVDQTLLDVVVSHVIM